MILYFGKVVIYNYNNNLFILFNFLYFILGLYTNGEKTSVNSPLVGMWDIGNVTIGAVTDTICHLERKVVPIIPFDKLQMDVTKYFSGGSARVYRGCYDIDTVVAIKILFCIELTPDKVVSFCNEVTLLNSLQHPNVVKCYGVAIMPPAISLVCYIK
jgi:hypothetical protein